MVLLACVALVVAIGLREARKSTCCTCHFTLVQELANPPDLRGNRPDIGGNTTLVAKFGTRPSGILATWLTMYNAYLTSE